MIGVTTDRRKRQVGKWCECKLGRRTFSFFPVIAFDCPERQPKIPATLQFMAALAVRRLQNRHDLLQFHRIEPSLCFLTSDAPKVAFIHQNMEVLYNKNSDIRWKYAPGLYYKLEDLLIPRFDSINVVHEKAVNIYQKRYPYAASKVRFLPTWMDPEVFYPLSQDERQSLRHRLCNPLGISGKDRLLVSVGRLDRQKDPLLLIESFAVLAKLETGVHLVVVGDGVLRGVVKKRIQKHRLEKRVTLAGLLPNDGVANWLRAADMMVLSSAYEGMPRCVVEAMGCGLPVATTDVGEVRRLVKSGINGEIAEVRSPDGFASVICRCLGNLEKYSGTPCLDAASQYVPSKVLEPVYETYRQLTECH